MSNIVRIIGDIHGDFYEYSKILNNCNKSIQVGDFGLGFPNTMEYPENLIPVGRHQFIRGNHDNPDSCKTCQHWISDGSVENVGTSIVMFIGGATSIDWMYRTPGVSWWADEECSLEQFEYFADLYEQVKPDVMITHEIPEFLVQPALDTFGGKKFKDDSRTRFYFEEMFKTHIPKFWFSGHWHFSFEVNVSGCQFRILDINEYVDFDFENLKYV